MQFFRTKPITHFKHTHLKPCLKTFDLVFLGIGAIIGAGVFVLTGVAAATQAGPAIIFSYLLAGIACMFTAFCYAELASSIGGSGSAYGYTYAGLGESIAWMIGWCLILEYSVSVSVVAIGWSSYMNNILLALGWHLPAEILHNPAQGGMVNLPAVLIILLFTVILCFGIKQSTRLNNIIVIIKFAVIALFVSIASVNVNPTHWSPFLPFGWHGVAQGAALVFFAYMGFDAVSTAAEEAINPQRDLPKGIIGSLLICALIYIVISGLLTGIVPYQSLNVASPVASALLHLGHHVAAGVVAGGIVASLMSVILVMFYGLTRIFYAIARDGLLPRVFYQVNPKTRAPIRIIIVSGIIMALIAGFAPVIAAAELMNIGTLTAFLVVCIGVIALRIRQPQLTRAFKVPLYPLSPILGALLCFYLMLNLSSTTWKYFSVWLIVGIAIYFIYSYRNSRLSHHHHIEHHHDDIDTLPEGK